MPMISVIADGDEFVFESYRAKSRIELAKTLLAADYDPKTEIQVFRDGTFIGNWPPLEFAALTISEMRSRFVGRANAAAAETLGPTE